MYKYELKKIFSKPGSLVALIVMVVVLIICCFSSLDVWYVNEQGEEMQGIEAARLMKEDMKKWQGPLDETKLRQAIAENQRLMELKTDDLHEQNVLYHSKQGFRNIAWLMDRAYSEDLYSFGGTNTIDSLNVEDAANFYPNRIRSLKFYLENDGKHDFTEPEKAYIISRFESLETPLYYDYYEGWDQLNYCILPLILSCILVSGYLVCGIFPDEFKYKAHSVLYASSNGRKKSTGAKILAGFTIITGVYWFTVLLYTAFLLLALGTDSWNGPIQISFGGWVSMYNITFLQRYILMILGGYAATLFMGFFGMYISSLSRSSVTAIIATGSVFLLSVLASFVPIKVIKKAAFFMPYSLIDISGTINSLNVMSIGSKVFDTLPLLFAVYIGLNILLVPLMYRNFSRK